MMNKTYGIIAGMGAFAGSNLYESINHEVVKHHGSKELDDSMFPQFWINQIPFRGSDYLGESDYRGFRESIEYSLRKMEALNVTHIAFACNTYDRDFMDIASHFPFKAISLNRIIEDEVLRLKPKMLSILSTRQAVENSVHDFDFPYAEIFPNQSIVDELVLAAMSGRAHDKREVFDLLIAEMNAEGADYHLLGCTELSLYNLYPGKADIIDSNKLLARYIVNDYFKK
jgi:aspartate/glutamate racemase